MTPEEIEYGSFPLIEKLKLLAEWAPLLSRLQLVAVAKTPHEQALAVVSTLQWAAGKSETDIDDQALRHIEALLKTKEAQEFIDWALSQVFGEED
jgi:hypothetical protein